LTLRPERPLFNVPFLRFLIARPTLADAFLEYLRAIMILHFRKVSAACAVGSIPRNRCNAEI
jgi:hypothetical protein